MKNVTISMDEDLLRWTRVEAAKQDVSVSRLISEMLAQRREAERGYESAMEDFLSRRPRRLGSGGRLPRREEIYEERVPRYAEEPRRDPRRTSES
ncbi:MAG: hypothetical protein Kow00129_07960 [Thermoleophilia bacterium]